MIGTIPVVGRDPNAPLRRVLLVEDNQIGRAHV